jgi:chromosome partitioning protein
MARRTLTLLVAVAICAPVAVGPEAASAQDRDRRVQPPTELLREYPFQQGKLRSRERSQPRPAQTPVADTTADAGGSRWLLVLLVAMGAAGLLALGVAGRRLAQAKAAGGGAPPPAPPPPAPEPPPAAPRPAPSHHPHKSRRACSYAVVNQKGGVGKTTVSLTVGVAAARRGSRVLIVDLDPQASATTVLAPGRPDRPTVADAMLNPAACSLDAAIVSTEWGLDLAPSAPALRSLETQRNGGEAGVLAEQLDTIGDYDLTLIDCPPSLGFLTNEALGAVSRALVVTEPTYLALQAIDELVDTLRDVSAERNPSLALAAVVLNRVETTAEHKRSLAEVEQIFGARALGPHIPKRAVLQDAMRQGVPPQDLPSHYAEEIAELFDALAEQLEAVPAKQQESARLAQPARVPDAVAIQSPSGRSARPDVSELKLRIREMRESGMTLQAIANRLNEEKVPTLRGGARWRPSAVQAASGYRRPSQRSQGERRPSSSRKGGGAR